LKIDSYRIGDDLAPDLDHLAALCDKPARALLVTHYLGFPQPMAAIIDFARDHNLLVIEDNTHGLYSEDPQGVPLGSQGDIGVSSLAKTLPIPDGGAYVLNNVQEKEYSAEVSKPPGMLAGAGKLKGMIEAAMLRRFPGPASAVKKHLRDPAVEFLKRRLDADYRPADQTAQMSIFGGRFLALDQASWGMFRLAKILLRHADHAGIADQRRQNFRTLDEIFEGDTSARALLPPPARRGVPLALSGLGGTSRTSVRIST
jgi:hypothetical protein